MRRALSIAAAGIVVALALGPTGWAQNALQVFQLGIRVGVGGSTTGRVELANSTNTNKTTIQPGAAGSALTFTLPTLAGSNGQCIQTNGSGVLSFGACGGSLPTSDSTSLVEDNGDGTKEVRIEAGGIATGTIRVWTAPDADLTVVGTATTQTLTNKTLAAASNVIDADTAVALAGNGSNCSAGQYPLGVDASGAVESCAADDDLPDADEVTEAMLKVVNAGSDEDCLTRETTTGDFEWQACGAGITVGSTTITSGTSGRLGFNGSGVYSEDDDLTWNSATWLLTISRSGSSTNKITVSHDGTNGVIDVGAGSVSIPDGLINPVFNVSNGSYSVFMGGGGGQLRVEAGSGYIGLRGYDGSVYSGFVQGGQSMRTWDSSTGMGGFKTGRMPITQATSASIALTSSWTVYVNTGATSLVTITLPDATYTSDAPTPTYTFCVTDADGIAIEGGSDTIFNGGSSGTGTMSSTTIGSCTTIVATGSTQWMALGTTGTWTVS